MYLLTSNTESCDEDDDEVGVDFVEELVDKPGTTNGTFLIHCNQFSCPFGEMWSLTAGPVVSITMILAELPERKYCGSFFKKHNCHE